MKIKLINGLDINMQPINILIEDTKIMVVSSELILLKTDKTIDLDNNLIMPGIIDCHTHMRDRLLCYKEDYATGSQACAHGGITTFIDMPNTKPYTITNDELTLKKFVAKALSIVNYGFYFGSTDDAKLDEIKRASKKTLATKIFMNDSTGKMKITDTKRLQGIIDNSQRILFHASGDVIDLIFKCDISKEKLLYFCHVANQADFVKITNYKKQGYNIIMEVTPHHLLLNDTMMDNQINEKLLQVKPPLASTKDNEFLIEMLNKGFLDLVGTDHAPHLLKEKETQITYGFPGVETSLILMLELVYQKKLTLKMIQTLMAEHPAEIFKLNSKGKIAKDYDADLVVVDLHRPQIIKGLNNYSKAKWTPFEGMQVHSTVLQTYVRGQLVFDVDKGIIKNSKKASKEINYE